MKLQRNVLLFNIFSFFSSLDFYVPIKVVYFHQITGSYSTASLIISFVWISQALLEIPTGVLSDLVGRKKTIVLGAFCSVIGYLLYAIGHIFWLFLLGAIFEGCARAFFSGNNNAYLHNLLSQAQKEGSFHHFYGKLNSIMAVAMFVAALGCGLLAQWSISLFMWVNLIPQVVAFIISLLLVEITHKEKITTNVAGHLREAFLEIRGNINLRYLSLSEILSGGGLAAYEYQAAVYAAVWPTWAIGIARAVQEGGVIPSFFYAGKIIDKFGVVKVLVIDWFTSTLGNVLAALTHSFLSPIFVMISLPLYGAADTANQNLLQKEFTERQRATISSLNSFGNSISFAIVLYICGLIANVYGPFIALLATQIFLLPANYYEYKFLRRIGKKRNF